MCRFLLVKSEHEFETAPYLERFAEVCRTSSEYQGDGWGVMVGTNGSRRLVKHLEPIWSADLSGFASARFLLAHARSAFRDSAPELDANMPFQDHRWAYAFNGELHGVSVKAEGTTGAAKVFHLMQRLDRGDMWDAFRRAVEVVRSRTRHIRALNAVLTDTERVCVASIYSGDPDYFALHLRRRNGLLELCSRPLDDNAGWSRLPNNTIREIA
jgi:predicted glutamine amidotransferase